MLKKTPFILTILIFTITSWVLVHVLAVLGVFIALALPIWWLLAPKTTTCFSCRSRKEGEWCSFCKKKVSMKDGTYPNPRNLASAIFNGLVVLLFSVISAMIVFIEARVFFKMGFPPTPKTVSFVIPTKGQYRLGEIFPVKIEIVGIKAPVNAIQADLGFDPTRLEVLNVSTQDSFANIFIQKDISNETGYVRLTGGLPNPGFSSSMGVFGTVYFRGKVPGIARIEFLPTSMVLANDSQGTNVLKDYSSVSYLILPEKITEEEEKLQNSLITMNPSVLGATSKTQIVFYQDSGVVLSASLDANLKPTVDVSVDETTVSKDLSSVIKPARILEQIDSFIVGSWMKFVELFVGGFSR